MEAKKASGDEDDSSLSVVEFLREVEEPLKEIHLPLGRGKFIYTSLLGTAAHLSTSQNIKAAFLILLLHPDPDPNPDPDPDPDLDLDLDPDPDPDPSPSPGPDPDPDHSHSDPDPQGGNLHGAREHPNWEGEILRGHLHHKCKQVNNV